MFHPFQYISLATTQTNLKLLFLAKVSLLKKAINPFDSFEEQDDCKATELSAKFNL